MIEFEEERNAKPRWAEDRAAEKGFGSKLIALTMKASGGAIKDERQASYALLIASGIIVIASIFALIRYSGTPLKQAKPIQSIYPSSFYRDGDSLPPPPPTT